MSEVNAPATLTPPVASAITFNGTSGDVYWLTNVTGLDGAPRRVTVEDKPRTDGGIWKPAPMGGRHIVIEGLLVPSDGTASARNTMADSLIDAVDEMFDTATGTWAWTPSGQTAHSIEVYGEMPVQITGSYVKSFIFGLYAPDPTITVA